MVTKRKIELMKLKKNDKSNENIQRLAIITMLDARYKEEIREGREVEQALLTAANKIKKDLEKERESAVKYDRKSYVENVDIQLDEVERFLPNYMSIKEIEDFVDTMELEDNFGKMMGIVKGKLDGKAQMKDVSKVLKTKYGK